MSIATGLAVLGQGADGTSRGDFESGLMLKSHGLDLATVALKDEEFRGALVPRAGVSFESANAIWSAVDLPLRPAFVALQARLFNSEFQSGDFANPRTLEQINQWVARKTHGRIVKIVDSLPPQTRVALINALHFKGRWQSPFDPRKTLPMVFVRGDGSNVSVPGMHRSGDMSYMETASFQAAALVFADPRFEMVVVLPKKGAEAATAAALRTGWSSTLDSANFTPSSVALELPRLAIEWGGDLLGTLRMVGFAQALGSKADFGAMTTGPVAIGAVAHRASFDVNEEGAEGAAATAVIGTRSARLEKTYTMNVDHPFYMLVREKLAGSALFMAYVAQPSGNN